MDFKTKTLIGLATYGVYKFLVDFSSLLIRKKRAEKTILDRLKISEAALLCEVGETFQKNDIVFRKISEKKWLAETLDYDGFYIGFGGVVIDNYIYKKIGEKVWSIKKIN